MHHSSKREERREYTGKNSQTYNVTRFLILLWHTYRDILNSYWHGTPTGSPSLFMKISCRTKLALRSLFKFWQKGGANEAANLHKADIWILHHSWLAFHNIHADTKWFLCSNLVPSFTVKHRPCWMALAMSVALHHFHVGQTRILYTMKTFHMTSLYIHRIAAKL